MAYGTTTTTPSTSTTMNESDLTTTSSDKKEKGESSKSKHKKEKRRHDEDERSEKKKSKRSKREVQSLENEESDVETKRLRTYSTNLTATGTGTTDTTTTTATSSSTSERRRTRSFDIKEENETVTAVEDTLTVDEWRKLHSITIKSHGKNGSSDNDIVEPFRKFTDTPFHKMILQSFERAGFVRPTAIQSQAWPIALQGRDMICIAKTGSGKTCGFLLPYFHKFLQQNNGPNTLNNRRRPNEGGPGSSNSPTKPSLLVLAPTRELSVQIQEEAQKFGRTIGIRSLCCYGGSPKYSQIAILERNGVECLIATPGRLNDLLEMKKVDLSAIEFLVLDEADRMLDMGFEPQIRSIVKYVPTKRQTLLFSATWPREIQKLAHDFLTEPIQINVGEVDALVANKDIQQTIVMLNRDDEKFNKLEELLRELTGETGGEDAATKTQPNTVKQHEKIIIFVAKKVSCTEIANRLWDDGFAVDSLHGDRPQWERTRVMTAFKLGVQLRMLIATDVAARGLDVKDVGVVINYDMPLGSNAVEDYIHRIGRTGRAGKKGKAYTFFTQADKKCAKQLVEVLQKAEQNIPPELMAMVPRQRFGGGGDNRGFSYGRGGGGRGRGYGGGGGGGYGRGGGRGGYGRGGGGGGGGYGRY